MRSIDTSQVVGLRDRGVLGVLAYTGARVGAAARLRLADLKNLGEHRALRFREKGGKLREIPVRHDLDQWLRAYLDAAGIVGQGGQGSALSRRRRQTPPTHPGRLHRAFYAPDAQAPPAGCWPARTIFAP